MQTHPTRPQNNLAGLTTRSHVNYDYRRSEQRNPDEAAVPGEAKTANFLFVARLEALIMDWAILIASGIMESVWAIALGKSDGLTHPLPTVIFFIALAASMLGLAHASKTLPMGTAYAVWVGIGAALTVAYGMVTGSEPANRARIVLICGLVACVIGLKLIGTES